MDKLIYRKKWLWIVSGAIIMFAAFVSLLPVVVKHYAEDWYRSQGVKSVEIGDIDFNLFTGVLVVEAMRVEQESGVVFSMAEAAVNLGMLDLFGRKILLQSVRFRELNINVSRAADQTIQIAGIILGGEKPQEKPQPEETGPGWGFGIMDTSIERLVVNYQDDKISTQLALNNATLNKALTWTPEETAVLVINGEVNSSPVSITADIKPFAGNPSFSGNLKVEGIDIKAFSELARPGLRGLSGTLTLDTRYDVVITTNSSLSIKTRGQYRLENADIQLQKQSIKSDSFNIEAAFELEQALEKADAEPVIKFFGDLNTESLSVSDDDKNIGLAQARKITVTNVEINGLNNISVEKTLLEEIKAISDLAKDSKRPANTLVSVAFVGVEKLELASFNQLTISKINLSQLAGNVSKDKKGKLLLIDDLTGKDQAGEQKPVEKQEKTEKQIPDKAEDQSFKFNIGAIEVSDKSRLTFKDASVIPKFEGNLLIKSLSLSNIDNSNKANESKFSLSGKLDKYSAVDVNGKAKLFSDINDFSVVAKVQKYEMPHLSSYTSQVLGYDLVSGQGNIDLKVIRVGEKIDGEAKLKLHNLTVKETSPEHMKELNEQLSIPLSSALSMLRDKNDDIKLTIPVTGKFLEPDVGIGDVINTALGKALKASTLSYLKYTFQPYGTLISIVQLAGSAASSIQLDPVSFETGVSQLQDESKEYLSKIAKVLKDREKIRIKLCGISTEGDRLTFNEQAKQARKPQITDEELFALAKKRSENIKEYLVDQFKVDPARLFVCHPQTNKEEKAKPEVELLI